MIIIFLLVSVSYMKRISNKDIIHAIDCGNYMGYHSFDGIKYKNDQFFQGFSQFIDYYNAEETIHVKQTSHSEIFLTQREGLNFFYQLPLKNHQQEMQNYILALYFAELQYQESNARVFEVYLGNKLIVGNLDIYKEVGEKRAYKIEIYFSISGQKLYYQDEQIQGAISKKNDLLIRFKAIKNQASIAGIILKFGKLQNNQTEGFEIPLSKNSVKGIDGLKKLSHESLKIIEQEVKDRQKELNQNETNGNVKVDQSKNSKQEIKLFEFSKRLMNLIINTPSGLILASSFLLICLITLWELFKNRKYYNKETMKIKDLKQD